MNRVGERGRVYRPKARGGGDASGSEPPQRPDLDEATTRGSYGNRGRTSHFGKHFQVAMNGISRHANGLPPAGSCNQQDSSSSSNCLGDTGRSDGAKNIQVARNTTGKHSNVLPTAGSRYQPEYSSAPNWEMSHDKRRGGSSKSRGLTYRVKSAQPHDDARTQRPSTAASCGGEDAVSCSSPNLVSSHQQISSSLSASSSDKDISSSTAKCCHEMHNLDINCEGNARSRDLASHDHGSNHISDMYRQDSLSAVTSPHLQDSSSPPSHSSDRDCTEASSSLSLHSSSKESPSRKSELQHGRNSSERVEGYGDTDCTSLLETHQLPVYSSCTTRAADSPFSEASSSLILQINSTERVSHNSELQHGRKSSEIEEGLKKLEPVLNVRIFDICLIRRGAIPKLKPPLFLKNRERRKEALRSEIGSQLELRSGMILLKNYLSLNDQIKIVEVCRDLGMGPGSFYKPGYGDDANLQLHMMCLGKNWDPKTSSYGDKRPTDGATPPSVPAEFRKLVEGAIQTSHGFIKQEHKNIKTEKILPGMVPDICIVNFYSNSGKLGLHKDKDESTESLDKGLPVVSFSIGDSAWFLYGDHGDVEKSEKVLLESGDVLIFGGKSRHIFHGVSGIVPKTAPSTLVEESNLRPGRLNLTFRKY